MRVLRIAPMFAILLLVDSRASHAATRVVAYAGQQAPGMPAGVIFDGISFREPVIDASGRVAFTAGTRKPDLTLGGGGVWSERPSGVTLVALQNNPAPGTATTFGSLLGAAIHKNNAGHVTFRSALGSGYGYFTDRSGSLAPIVLEGQTAPLGHVISDLSHPGLAFLVDDGARPLFYAYLDDPNLSFTGLYKEFNSGLGRLALEGEPAGWLEYDYGPVLGSPFRPAAISDLGQAVARTSLDSPDDPPIGAIHMNMTGGFGPVVVQGTIAPQTEGTFFTFGEPSVNNAGQLAFDATISGPGITSANSGGVWAGLPGSLQLVAREATQAPGVAAGITFTDSIPGEGFQPQPVINGAGEVLFQMGLAGPGVTAANNVGLWAGTPGNLSLVAREGDPALSIGPGATYTFISTSGRAINANGQVMFTAFFASPGGPGLGLFAQDAAGVVQLIARDGQTVQVAPGDVRTIEDIDVPFFSTGNQDGRPSAFNDAGHVAFLVEFTNNTRAILVSDAVAGPTFLAGDYNDDGIVDAADYVLWRKHLGSLSTTLPNDTSPGSVLDIDYTIWRNNFGETSGGTGSASAAVPEPQAATLMLLAVAVFCVVFLGARCPARYNHRIRGHQGRSRGIALKRVPVTKPLVGVY